MVIAIFLIPYLVLLGLWTILSLLITWELIKIVNEAPATGIVLLLYGLGAAANLAVTWFFVSGLDWATPIFS